jgi:CheY-like chemotaxis protein
MTGHPHHRGQALRWGPTQKLLSNFQTSRYTSDKPEASSLPQGAGETILIIEDDTDLRTLTVRMVKTLSYNVIDVPDAKSAYDIIHAGQMVDLVLSDIVLPGGVSGLEFADQIKVDFPALKIIFMSGYPDKAAKQNGVIGADVVFLNKPFQRRHLAEALQEALL